MKVTPDEFKATEDDPFRLDLLNRKPHVDALCNVLRSIQGHAVVSIEGSWGSGKTAFVRMCSAQLQQQNVQVVNFNAWQESYTNNPVMDLVSAMTFKIGGSWSKQTRQTFTDVGWTLARMATRGMVDRGTFRKAETPKFVEWELIKSKLVEFQSLLEGIASASHEDNNGRKWYSRLTNRRKQHSPLANSTTAERVVVLIDELDRCRPDYALELIEVVRNLFAVNGVIVLLAINREELCHSIQRLYGTNFDTDRYLRRFVDLPFTLPPPSEDRLSEFALALLSATELDSQVITAFEPHHESPRMLGTIAAATNHNLRDLQQSIHSSSVAIAATRVDDREKFESVATQRKIVALIVLRTLNKAAFQDLAYGNRDAYVAVAAMNRVITDDPTALEEHSNRDRAHRLMEASLLAESYDTITKKRSVLQGHTTAQDAFIKRYSTAFRKEFGDPHKDAGTLRAGWIVKEIENNAEKDIASSLEIHELVGIIDLIAYKPSRGKHRSPSE